MGDFKTALSEDNVEKLSKQREDLNIIIKKVAFMVTYWPLYPNNRDESSSQAPRKYPQKLIVYL